MPEIDLTSAPKRKSLYQVLIWLTVKPVRIFMEYIMLPWLRYAAKTTMVIEVSSEPTAPIGYIESSGPVNSLLLMAAFNEQCVEVAENRAGAISELNAILESVQQSERLSGAAMMMLGGLIAAGQSPEVAITQLAANWISIGMRVERRLQSANAGKPQPVETEDESANI